MRSVCTIAIIAQSPGYEGTPLLINNNDCRFVGSSNLSTMSCRDSSDVPCLRRLRRPAGLGHHSAFTFLSCVHTTTVCVHNLTIPSVYTRIEDRHQVVGIFRQGWRRIDAATIDKITCALSALATYGPILGFPQARYLLYE